MSNFAQRFNTPVDLQNHGLLNLRLQSFAVLPQGIEAQFAFDSTVKTPVYHDGQDWVVLDPRKASNIPLSALATDPLARANHTGTQLASTISDFNTQVRATRLDQLAMPTAVVSFNGQRLSNLGTPTNATDATTKAYVDNLVSSSTSTAATRLANPRNFSLAGVLTSATVSFNGTQDVVLTAEIADGALTIAKVAGLQSAINARIATSEKGAPDGIAPLGPDAKVPSEFLPSYVDDVVEVATFNDLPAHGETGKIYVTIEEGNKIYRWSGSTYISVNDAVSTADKATQLATSRSFSITGVVTAAARTFNGTQNVQFVTEIADGALSVDKTEGLRAALDGKAGKFAAPIGDGTNTSFTLTHNLGTEDVVVTVRNASTKEVEYAGVTIISANQISVTFAQAPDLNEYRVVVLG